MTRHVDFHQSWIRAGVAQCDITPPVGIYHRMWGAATHDVSTGVHRPLTATVMVLASHDDVSLGAPVIVVAIDHCLLWTAEMHAMLNHIAHRCGVAVESITIYFSHTHGAGLMGLERKDLPGGDLIAPYLDEIAQKIADLVVTAKRSLSSATITYGSGRCSLATNRDFWDAEKQQYVCGFNPDGSADDTVIVGRVTDEHGKVMMTIVNYACHPTTLAWDNTVISPDYVGAMRELIQHATEAPCFFIQGASGDIGPREGFVGDLAVADRNGRQLGYAALSALEALPPPKTRFTYAGPVVSGATIGTWKHEAISGNDPQRLTRFVTTSCGVDLPLRPDLPKRDDLLADQAQWQLAYDNAVKSGDAKAARDARAMVERATRRLVRVAHLPDAETIAYRVPLLKMGDAIWISLNGEHYNVIQTQLRSRFPNHTLIIGTIANGSDVWYLPDKDSYGKGLYQEEASILSKGSLEMLIAALENAIGELTGDPVGVACD